MSDERFLNRKINLSKEEIENFMLLIVRNGHLPVSVSEIDSARIVHKIDDCPSGEEILKSLSSFEGVPCLREIYFNLGFSEDEVKMAEDLVINRYRSALKRSLRPDSETERVVVNFFGLLQNAEELMDLDNR